MYFNHNKKKEEEEEEKEINPKGGPSSPDTCQRWLCVNPGLGAQGPKVGRGPCRGECLWDRKTDHDSRPCRSTVDTTEEQGPRRLAVSTAGFPPPHRQRSHGATWSALPWTDTGYSLGFSLPVGPRSAHSPPTSLRAFVKRKVVLLTPLLPMHLKPKLLTEYNSQKLRNATLRKINSGCMPPFYLTHE